MMKMLINCWWRCWLTGYTLPEKKCISVNLVHSTRSRVRFDCPSTEALRKVQVSHILLSACASEEGGEGGGEYGKSLEQSMTEARWYVAFTVLEAKLLLCQQRMLFDMLGRWHCNNTNEVRICAFLPESRMPGRRCRTLHHPPHGYKAEKRHEVRL